MFVKQLDKNIKTLENLTIQLYGDYGNTEDIKPQMKNRDENDLTAQKLLHFHTKIKDLGYIYKIKVKQNLKKKFIKKWYLDRVQVSRENEIYKFEYKKWIQSSGTEQKKDNLLINIYEEVR